MVETSQEATIIRRCQATIVDTLIGPCDHAKIAELAADLDRLSSNRPERSRLAAGMLTALFRKGPRTAVSFMPHIARMLEIAETDPPSDLQWTHVRSFARTLSLIDTATDGQPPDFLGLEAEMEELAEMVADHPMAEPVMGVLRTINGFIRAMAEGNESVLHRTPAELMKFADLLKDNPERSTLMDIATLISQSVASNRLGVHAATLEHDERLQDLAKNLPEGHLLRKVLADMSTRIAPISQLLAESGPVGAGESADDQTAE